MPRREIRDPVHGFINRSEEEQNIIDIPIFQRLRRIKQLAMAHLVYPGANHTRFEHSLGVMHIAGLMCDVLGIGEEDKTIIRFAALLHDIGHGPFSHVSENILEQFVGKDQTKNADLEEIHELITADIIINNRQIIKILGESRIERIVNILKGRGDPLLTSIISGPIDADKQDYLLRDSYFCGVKYGIFDIERLHNTLKAYNDKGFKYLSISGPDGIHSLEQYILAKYYMTTQVYKHKIRLVTDAMIIRALELGILEDKLTFLADIYQYNNSSKYVNNYCEWDDNRIIHEILKHKSKYAKEIFRRLIDRRLFKNIFKSQINRLPRSIRTTLSNISKPGMSQKRINFEQNIGEAIKIDSRYVIVHSYTIKSVRPKAKDSEGSILVDSEGQKNTFENESTLFKSINAAMQDQYIEVYAPVIYRDDKDKKVKRQEYQEHIKDIIIDHISREN